MFVSGSNDAQSYSTDIFKVLAIAIVVTVLLGCVKLVYIHIRSRKYAAVAEQERQEQAAHRQRGRQGRGTEDVPFGIRAIEKGIEVEGVYISRPTTPELAIREASLSRRASSVDLEKQGLPLKHARTPSASTTATARPTSSSFARSRSNERNLRRDTSPQAPIAKPAKTQHPPCSYSRFSNIPYNYRRPTNLSTLEGLDAIQRAATRVNPDGDSSGSSGESGTSGADVESIAASAPRLLNAEHTRQQSGDLDMLDSHRMSQAAEVGQLAPRSRRPSEGSNGSGITLPTAVATRYGKPHATLHAGASESTNDPSPTTGFNSLPPAVRRASMPDVTPFAKFCQTAPPSPLPRSYSRPESLDSQASVKIAGGALMLHTSVPSSPTTSSPRPSPPSEEPLKRQSFERQEPQIMRGHGSGFEILRPGTLGADQAKSAPPVSLQNGGSRNRSSSREKRRLQKRRRPSFDSMASSRKSVNGV